MYMREIGRYRWLRALRGLDERSRFHLRGFCRQLAFVVLLFSASTLLIDQHRPILFLSLMRTMLGFSAAFVFGVALLTRRPVSPTSLCISDQPHGPILMLVRFSGRLTRKPPVRFRPITAASRPWRSLIKDDTLL
jgi:hypothetical protein